MGSALMVPLVVVAVFSVGAAITDLRSFRVPNIMTFPLIVTGIVYHAVVGGFTALQSSLLGAFFGLAILFVFYAMGAMGAGDVKLMAGIGAWLGMPATVYVFGIAGLATGLYSVLLLAWGRRSRRVGGELRIGLLRLRALGRHLGAEERVEAVVKQSDRRQRLIPFAAMVALAVGILLVWACRS